MPVVLQTAGGQQTSELARRRLLSRRGEPLFLADWERPVFMHYEIDADVLQRAVPFDLDLYEGRAYVSLVAFTMRGMRFRIGGRLSEWLCRPIATHEFLNVRTYVRHRGEAGIYFLSEWLSNPLSVRLGPWTFGLPYRLGEMGYQHRHEIGELQGMIRKPGESVTVSYHAELEPYRSFEPCPEGSLDEFLLERYTAFTSHGSNRRFFRIWHPPWEQAPIEVNVSDESLLMETWPWFGDARLVGGNYSPGARNVWMGWPHKVNQDQHRGRLRTFFEIP